MRLLIQLILILLLFLAAIVGAVAWKALPQLQFEQRDMDWQWNWSYYHQFSNGIQQARTQDTKQLLLRRVYLEESLAIYVMTTLDNKFEIDVVKEESCKPDSSIWAMVSINNEPASHVPMVCDSSGETYFHRHVRPKLVSLEFGVEKAVINEDFKQWPIDDIKVDQFKQQHSSFFEKQGEKVEHQWLRD